MTDAKNTLSWKSSFSPFRSEHQNEGKNEEHVKMHKYVVCLFCALISWLFLVACLCFSFIACFSLDPLGAGSWSHILKLFSHRSILYRHLGGSELWLVCCDNSCGRYDADNDEEIHHADDVLSSLFPSLFSVGVPEVLPDHMVTYAEPNMEGWFSEMEMSEGSWWGWGEGRKRRKIMISL